MRRTRPTTSPVEWSDKYRGKFDQGWDALREETFARQKELGVVPESAELTARHDEIPAWDETPEDLRPVMARQMEVYAGFLEHTDHHVGRLIDALAELEVLDDTLVYVIIGDNGASAEGDLYGCFNELLVFNGANALQTTEFMASRIDDFGTPKAYNHYAVGWAHAMNTPYQWTKQVASHWGGTRNGTIVHWPSGIDAKGEVRNQFHHVIDVAPTVLEAAGLPEPTFVHGIQQRPYEGVSMSHTFEDADAAEHHETQYFEMFVNRGIYHQGWTAVTRHSNPWDVTAPMPAYADDRWELYGPDDWTQAHDLAAENPEQLAHLQQKFLLEASKYKVFPLDDRRIERFNPDLAGRPTLIRGNSQVLFGGMGRLTENVVLNVKNKSHAVTADLTVARRRGERGHRRPGRSFRRLEHLPPRGPPVVLLQPVRHPALPRPRRPGGPGRRPPGPARVRLRRRRTRQGRHRGPLRRRDPGRQRPGGGDRADDLLWRRDPGRRIGQRYTRQRRLRQPRQRLHRPDPPGPDRPRGGRRGQ